MGMVSAGPENLLAEVDDEPRRERQRAVRRQMTSEDRTLVDGHVNLGDAPGFGVDLNPAIAWSRPYASFQ